MDFMGHQLTAQGLKPELSKVGAILKLETPNIKEDIERLNGTVNDLAKFLPKLPKGQGRLQKFQLETEKDETLQVLKTTILKLIKAGLRTSPRFPPNSPPTTV